MMLQMTSPWSTPPTVKNAASSSSNLSTSTLRPTYLSTRWKQWVERLYLDAGTTDVKWKQRKAVLWNRNRFRSELELFALAELEPEQECISDDKSRKRDKIKKWDDNFLDNNAALLTLMRQDCVQHFSFKNCAKNGLNPNRNRIIGYKLTSIRNPDT